MSADQPRDWDKELAEIDKIIAKTPAKPPEGGAVATGPGKAPVAAGSGPAPRAIAAGPVAKREIFATWIRVLLGAALAAAMTQWPYAHACGTPLFLYMAAVGVVGVAGIWSAVSSWRRRMGRAHLVSLLVIASGAALAAAILLPRLGYAESVASWFCP